MRGEPWYSIPLHPATSHPGRLPCDPLTGLLPREAFLAQLAAGLTTSPFGPPLSLVLLDIDRLGKLNADFGEDFGNLVLRAVGADIKRSARNYSAAGRVSGGTFAVALPLVSPDRLEHFAAGLVKSLSTKLLQLSPRALVTLSAGAVACLDAKSVPRLLTLAEHALAEAKIKGRNQAVVVTDHPPVTDDQPVSLGRRLQDALDTKSLELAYQPVVCAKSHAVTFHECLLRLPGPDGTLLTAGDLIPVAEGVGLVRAVDAWVFDRATCELAASPATNLSLNVSALSIADPVWLARLECRTRQLPGIAERLIVEITETAASQNPDAVPEAADRVRRTGARVAIDDFGAGYTSIAQLRGWPVDMVKIDGLFTRQASALPESRLILETLIQLAHGLGFQTVAEQAETSEDASFLAASGATYLQGYHFGRPARHRQMTRRSPAAATL